MTIAATYIHMTIAKEKYKKLCSEESSIPIFSQAWWLDATVGEEHWDVALVEKGGVIKAAMPYAVKKRLGLRYLVQPALTQTLGPWIRPSQSKYFKQIGDQNKLLDDLINKLPAFDYFSQSWHYTQTNWLPFYWRGFQESTCYTYILNDLTNEEVLWTGLRENIRGDIRKAREREGLIVREDASLDDFLKLNAMTFSRQGMDLPYTEDFIKKIDKACASRECRKILVAEDKKGRQHAGVYIIWDDNSAYYLMGGGDPELRNSGATSLCLWEAIKYAATATKTFDFEGSMLKPVERFCRAFGAIQTPYFTVTKTQSRLLKLARILKG